VEVKGFILTIGELSGVAMNGVNVAIMNLYAPCSNSEKFALWIDIEQIKANKNCTVWCVLGDFNSVKFEKWY